MKSIQQTMEEISADFEILPDPKDKFVQLLDLGKQSSGLPLEFLYFQPQHKDFLFPA